MGMVSLSELSRRIGRDKSLVSRWVRDGKIAPPLNGLFDEDEVRHRLKGSLDPARAKPLTAAVDRTLRRAPNASSLTEPVDPKLPVVVEVDDLVLPPVTASEDDCPKPDAYRARTDIPDAFLRGAVFAFHQLAFFIPQTAAVEAAGSGADARTAYTLFHRMRLIMQYTAGEELGCLLGLCQGNENLPEHLVPPAVYDISARHLAALADEEIDIPSWEAWRKVIDAHEATLWAPPAA